MILLLCILATLVLGWQASKVTLAASFGKTIPASHPYILNCTKHKADLAGQGNAVRIAVESRSGDTYDKNYLETLRRISDALYLMPGVDRAFVRSL